MGIIITRLDRVPTNERGENMSVHIMALRIKHRNNKAPGVQEILTRFGCDIKMRLGLHEAGREECSNEGLILLQLTAECPDLEKELNSVEGVTAKTMSI